MKLRNKKTGEIVDTLCSDDITKGISFGIDHHDGNPTMAYYCSLAELNEDWEDYEEPKDFYFIGGDGGIAIGTFITEGLCRYSKEIGNYFSSREEAEKAVEKLKALTEAKEDGLKIKGYYYNHEDLVILADIGKCNKLTLDTLFGKEID